MVVEVLGVNWIELGQLYSASEDTIGRTSLHPVYSYPLNRRKIADQLQSQNDFGVNVNIQTSSLLASIEATI